MKIRLDYNYMMEQYIGKNGVSINEIERLNLDKIRDNLGKKRNGVSMGWRELPYNQDEICDEIIKYVDSVKEKITAFVVLGIGGSALGPICVQQAINHPHYNELDKKNRNGYPRFYVLDNIDPEKLSYLFDIIDIKTTIFNVISKSGATSETMSQFMIIKEMLQQKLGKEASEHIVCVTDEQNGNLIKIAKEEKYKTFFIPQSVGGRFSELSPAGLLPASFCGIDIKEMLKGAKVMDEMCKEDVYKNPALMYAGLSYISMQKGKNISVMMPYADSLKFVSDWFAQLWAESLGKKYDNDKNEIFTGQTPVKALGATDQHSQIQLFMEGPFDKIITFIKVDKFKKTMAIPKIYEDINSIGFLGGITQDELIHAEQMATEYALSNVGRLNMTITLPYVNENTLGQLLYMFEMSVAYMGELLNINAFDQPGVEDAKNATYAYFGRDGYEQKRKKLLSREDKNCEYII